MFLRQTLRRFMRESSGRYAKAEGLLSRWAMGEIWAQLGRKTFFVPESRLGEP
jgi:hypothetical protein